MPGSNPADITEYEVVLKTSDEIVNNSATLQDDDELLFAMEANGIYEIEIYPICEGQNTSNVRMAFSLPVAAAMKWSFIGVTEAGTVIVQTQDTSGVQGMAYASAGYGAKGIIKGVIINGANAGNAVLQWAQYTAQAHDTTMKENSFLKYRKLN